MPTTDTPPAIAASARGLSKWPSIFILALCAVLALSLWFSASAVIPALRAEFGLSGLKASLLASSVAAGFVVGTLTSASLGLSDRIDPRVLFAGSASVAAAANASVLLVPADGYAVPLLRFAVGLCMAGVYPVGMKMAASWAKGDMGLLIGLLVGALTLGSASPHLIDALGGLDWRFTQGAASGLAACAAALVFLVGLGPGYGRAAAFKARYALRAWTQRSLRLANLGYFGHMWELYAMWAWVGLFLHASFAVNPGGPEAAALAKYATFAAIAAGALGCLLGGLIADRLGRTTLTIGAMAISGACCLTAGFLFGADPVWLVALCLVWGVTVVADSAQFSSSVMELSPRELTGTMVTVQTCVGFLLTTVTIHLIPPLAGWVGWQWAFAALAAGPFLGVWAMAALRAHPDAAQIAGGRR